MKASLARLTCVHPRAAFASQSVRNGILFTLFLLFGVNGTLFVPFKHVIGR